MGDDPFWFRGHEDFSFSLTPSALRYTSAAQRQKALSLLSEFKRIAEIKLERPPKAEEQLLWVQLAQHNGLPTRLLDWTESATTALFFACLEPNKDGFFFVLNPIALNRLSYPGRPQILDTHDNAEIISTYLKLGPKKIVAGRHPIAINPVWNSQRLMTQKGVFTLHGTKFDLDGPNVPSLVALPIPKEAKRQLRKELGRIGVDEMTLFPELEHTCKHLKWQSGLF